MRSKKNIYVLCIKNDEYPSSLEKRKLYPCISDKDAEKKGLMRIIDETGEDYLYPASYFTRIPISKNIEKVLIS